MSIIECRNITKSFDHKNVLENFNISFEKGKIYALLGRNGAGKTTLSKTIVTKYLPDSGSVMLNDKEAYENVEELRKICLKWLS